MLATPVLAAVLPPGSGQPIFLISGRRAVGADAVTVMLAPWERLPLWAQSAPPLVFFGVVLLAEVAASETLAQRARADAAARPVAGRERYAHAAGGLARGARDHGTAGVLTTGATAADWRRACVSLLVAGLISLLVQRAVESNGAARLATARWSTTCRT